MNGEQVMDELSFVEIALGKDVNKGDPESLLSLFRPNERFKRMKVLMQADEHTPIRVVVEGLWEGELKLGNDVEEGQQKTIMTLFWYSERSKRFEIKRNAKADEIAKITMLLPNIE